MTNTRNNLESLQDGSEKRSIIAFMVYDLAI